MRYFSAHISCKQQKIIEAKRKKNEKEKENKDKNRTIEAKMNA